MLFCFTVPYYTHYYTYEIMMKVLRSPSSPMDFAGHLTQKHRKSTAKTLKAHYNGIGFWWYNRMYSMVFPYIPMIFWYFMSILFAWCSNDLHIFGVFRGPVAFEPTKILGGWNFCRCGILYATCTERGRDGEGMACGHVVVNDGWLDMWFFLMCFGCFRTGSIHSDVRCFKPDMLIARRSWTCVSPRGTLIKCRVSFLDDHSSCPLLFSNSNSGIWIWQALRNIRRRSCLTCITDGSPLVLSNPILLPLKNPSIPTQSSILWVVPLRITMFDQCLMPKSCHESPYITMSKPWLILNSHIFRIFSPFSHLFPFSPKKTVFFFPRYGLLVAMHSYGLGGKPLGSVAKFTELCREMLGEAAMPSEEHLVCGSLELVGGWGWGVGCTNVVQCLQCEAPKIAKLVYNSNNYGLWYL